MPSKAVNTQDPGQAVIFLNDLFLYTQGLNDFQIVALQRVILYEWEHGHAPQDDATWRRVIAYQGGHRKAALDTLKAIYDQNKLVLRMRERRKDRIAERENRSHGAKNRGLGVADKSVRPPGPNPNAINADYPNSTRIVPEKSTASGYLNGHHQPTGPNPSVDNADTRIDSDIAGLGATAQAGGVAHICVQPLAYSGVQPLEVKPNVVNENYPTATRIESPSSSSPSSVVPKVNINPEIEIKGAFSSSRARVVPNGQGPETGPPNLPPDESTAFDTVDPKASLESGAGGSVGITDASPGEPQTETERLDSADEAIKEIFPMEPDIKRSAAGRHCVSLGLTAHQVRGWRAWMKGRYPSRLAHFLAFGDTLPEYAEELQGAFWDDPACRFIAMACGNNPGQPMDAKRRKEIQTTADWLRAKVGKLDKQEYIRRKWSPYEFQKFWKFTIQQDGYPSPNSVMRYFGDFADSVSPEPTEGSAD